MTQPAVLFIHGAANGAWVWDAWRRELKGRGWQAIVLDLRGHGRSLPIDMSEVTMEDYVADVESVTGQVASATGAHPVIAGWSMGGLVAMMYAAKHQETPGLLLFSPSPPEEVAGKASLEEVRRTPNTPFGPELYGVYADDAEASRAALSDLTEAEAAAVLANSAGAVESGFARRQRKRGISIPPGSIRAPALLVHGEAETDKSPELNRRLALYLGAARIEASGVGHWGIVYSEKTVQDLAPEVAGWLEREAGEH
jgi:pimeloyl-ACP methyl ester carboxylesterase